MHDTKHTQFLSGHSIINCVRIIVHWRLANSALAKSRIKLRKIFQALRQNLKSNPKFNACAGTLFFIVFDCFGDFQPGWRGDDDFQIHLRLKSSLSSSSTVQPDDGRAS